MPYYCVFITFGSKLTRKLVNITFYDLTEERLRKSIVEPYMNGEEFFISGRCIDPHLIEMINIYETTEKVTLAAESDPFGDVDDILNEIRNGERGKFVTDYFITAPPSAKKTQAERKLSKKVFLVHGRDLKPMEELKTMLTEFGLNPIVLHEQPSGSRTIVEKLEKHSDVGYAFIILTPDDIGGSLKGHVSVLEATITENLKPRARQNVILEFGFFIGLLGRDKVCCLYKGNVELPSDMHGIVYVPFEESIEEVRGKIVKELGEAGYHIPSPAQEGGESS